MRWYVRCLTVTNGIKCHKRMTLPKRLTDYVTPPQCPLCGGSRWYVDKYLMNNRDHARTVLCHCSAYPYPHRAFGGKCSRKRFAFRYWNQWFGAGLCTACNCLNTTEEVPYCEVVQGQESAKYCAAVQEFELSEGLTSL